MNYLDFYLKERTRGRLEERDWCLRFSFPSSASFPYLFLPKAGRKAVPLKDKVLVWPLWTSLVSQHVLTSSKILCSLSPKCPLGRITATHLTHRTSFAPALQGWGSLPAFAACRATWNSRVLLVQPWPPYPSVGPWVCLEVHLVDGEGKFGQAKSAKSFCGFAVDSLHSLSVPHSYRMV